MTEKKAADNLKAVQAAQGKEELDRFLIEEQQHILLLTGKVLKKRVTESDEEYSVALRAVSEAVASYNKSRGDFWSYAAFVIKSRETDYYRSLSRIEEKELTVSPEVFGGETSEEDSYDSSLRSDINDKTAVYIDNDLKEEIELLSQKLKDFGISFFDLAECSPKAKKSKEACGNVLKAVFTPPPLIDEIIKNRALPIKKILDRQKVSRKLIDRHRKYLISASIILSGDYPLIAEYIPAGREIISGGER